MPHLKPKHLLKRTIGRRLPPSLLKAPKMSFNVPLREWFKQDDFLDRLRNLERTDFGVNRAVIGEIVEGNRSGRQDYGDFIWRLFVLKKWTEGRLRHMSEIVGTRVAVAHGLSSEHSARRAVKP